MQHDPTVFVACDEPRLRGRIVSALRADCIPLSPGPLPPPEVAVLAFDLSASNLVAELRTAVRGLPVRDVAIVSPDPGPLGARRALRAGAAGIVLESGVEIALAPAVRAVAAGLTAFPVTLRRAADELSLSRRERQVLRLVAAGKTNQEIAGALFLAESTVKSHLTSLFRKVGANSRTEVARLALDPEEGLSHLLAPQARLTPKWGTNLRRNPSKIPQSAQKLGSCP
jgi:two-component system NarL family response regulator